MKRNPYFDSEDDEAEKDWNPHSNFDEDEFNLINQNQQQSDPIESEKKRPSHKNKYINKITLIKPEETANTKKKHAIENEFALQPDQLKKLKNRQAAKQSRQRKKLYINLIEEQTKKLQKEIELTNREIQSCKIEIQKSTFNNNQSIGTFDTKLIHVFKRMEKLINADEGEERNNDLNVAIDSVLYRFGATGKERKGNITESYRQIMSLALPIVNRYLLWTCKERTHLFLTKDSFNLEYEAWFSEMRKKIGASFKGNDAFLQAKRNEVVSNLQEMIKQVDELKNAKDQIQDFCNILDNLFLQIREILTPAQNAKLILLIQKYKYRQELRYLEGASICSQVEHLGSPRKQFKVDELL